MTLITQLVDFDRAKKNRELIEEQRIREANGYKVKTVRGSRPRLPKGKGKSITR